MTKSFACFSSPYWAFLLIITLSIFFAETVIGKDQDSQYVLKQASRTENPSQSSPPSTPTTPESITDRLAGGIEAGGPIYNAGEGFSMGGKEVHRFRGGISTGQIKRLLRNRGVSGRTAHRLAQRAADGVSRTGRFLKNIGKAADRMDKIGNLAEAAGSLYEGDYVGVGQTAANTCLSGFSASGGALAGAAAGAVAGPPGAAVGAVAGAVAASYAYDKYGHPIIDSAADATARYLDSFGRQIEKDRRRLRTDLGLIGRSDLSDSPLSEQQRRTIHNEARQTLIQRIIDRVRRIPPDKIDDRINYLEKLKRRTKDPEGIKNLNMEIALLQDKRSQEPALVAISVTPSEKTIKINESVTFAATAIFNDRSTKDVTGEAVWSPGNSFTANKPGEYTVSASYKGISGTATVTVTKTLTALRISPQTSQIKIGQALTLSAVATFDDGSTKDVTGEAVWSPGNSFTANKPGEYRVTAAYKGFSAIAAIRVISGRTGPPPGQDDSNPMDSSYLAAQNLYSSRENDREQQVQNRTGQDLYSASGPRGGRPSQTTMTSRLQSGLQTIQQMGDNEKHPHTPHHPVTPPEDNATRLQEGMERMGLYSGCRDDSDCPGGKICSEGHCIDSDNNNNGTAPHQDSDYSAPTGDNDCSSSSDCPSGQVCRQGHCTKTHQDSDCRNGRCETTYCKGHDLYCSEGNSQTVKHFPKSAVDQNMDNVCDICGRPCFISREHLAHGLKTVLRGDVKCSQKPPQESRSDKPCPRHTYCYTWGKAFGRALDLDRNGICDTCGGKISGKAQIIYNVTKDFNGPCE